MLASSALERDAHDRDLLTEEIDLIAETRDGRFIDRKEKVLIVRMQDGVAQVTHLRQLPGPRSDESQE